MTYNEREAIFAKESMTIPELGALMGIERTRAGKLMREIKANVGDRLGIEGKLLIDDYLRYFGLPREGRYDRQRGAES